MRKRLTWSRVPEQPELHSAWPSAGEAARDTAMITYRLHGLRIGGEATGTCIALYTLCPFPPPPPTTTTTTLNTPHDEW